MPYKSPKDLATKFEISLKTVYNYLTRYPKEIRTKKEFWKKIVNFEDFKKVFYKNSNTVQKLQNEDSKTPIEKKVWTENESILKEYKIALQRGKNMEKQNLSLQNQLSKYGILLQEEKADKKERQAKYDQLNQSHLGLIESFWKEKFNFSKKYFILIGICLSLAFLLIIVILPIITNWLQSFNF